MSCTHIGFTGLFERAPTALANEGTKGGVRIKWGCHLPRLPKQTGVVETVNDDVPHSLWTSTSMAFYERMLSEKTSYNKMLYADPS